MKIGKPNLFIISLLLMFVLAVVFIFPEKAVLATDAGTTTASYRIDSIREKLAGLSEADIEKSASKFPDIAKHRAKTSIGKLVALGIISGMSNGTFQPDKPIQADHFIRMVVCALGFKPGQGLKYWAQPCIDIAKDNGLILDKEISDYKKPISREKAAGIIVRATLLTDDNSGDKYTDYIIGKLKDYPSVSDGCKQNMIDAHKLGLFTSSNGYSYPKNNLTRTDAAIIIVRLLDKMERQPLMPGKGEILKLIDNKYNPVEIYPGIIPETFQVAKATQTAIPKAKGYVDFFYNPNNGMVFAWFYKDKASHDQSVLNMVGSLEIAYNSKDESQSVAYFLSIDDSETYRQLFADYTHEIFKTIFDMDSDKAIALHDKYMYMKYTRTDGLNQYEEIKLNNRATSFVRYSNTQFSVQIKLIGMK